MFCIRYVGGVVPQKQVPSSELLYHTALVVTQGAASGSAGEDGAAFPVQILLQRRQWGSSLSFASEALMATLY